MRTIIAIVSVLGLVMLAQAQETPKEQRDGSYDTDSVPTTEQDQPTETKKGKPDYGSPYSSDYGETKKPEEKK
jgi:hypothetical protein